MTSFPLFRLSSEPIASVPPFAVAGSTGALVTFDGIVRDNNDGRPVHELEYSSYAVLAEREGERIVADARERFGLDHAACIHRVGALAVGEVAVRVWAAAPHREAAFAACVFIIDEVKAHVPIWKHERYADGEERWLDGKCDHAAGHRGP